MNCAIDLLTDLSFGFGRTGSTELTRSRSRNPSGGGTQAVGLHPTACVPPAKHKRHLGEVTPGSGWHGRGRGKVARVGTGRGGGDSRISASLMLARADPHVRLRGWLPAFHTRPGQVGHAPRAIC